MLLFILYQGKHITPWCCSKGSFHPQSYPSGKHVFERSQNIPNSWPMHRCLQHQHQTLHQIQTCNLWFEFNDDTNVHKFTYFREDPVLKNWAGCFLYLVLFLWSEPRIDIYISPFCDSCFSTFSTCSQPKADLSMLPCCTPNFPPNPVL